MKVEKKSTENCHFYSREKSLYVAWACFRNVQKLNVKNSFSSLVRNEIYRSVSDLLSKNSLFVCQLSKDKSLPLRARDSIFLTTDYNSELLLNKSLLEHSIFFNGELTEQWDLTTDSYSIIGLISVCYRN